MWDEQTYFDGVRRILREIKNIKTDTGYSTDQILMAMLVVCGIDIAAKMK